jgi:hypothetical protein
MWRDVYPEASMSVATVSPGIIHRTTRASATTISAMQMADGRWKIHGGGEAKSHILPSVHLLQY